MKCRLRWVDPQPESIASAGPFSCGRPKDHPGLCAHAGAGAWALWKGDDLFMAIQTKGELPGIKVVEEGA